MSINSIQNHGVADESLHLVIAGPQGAGKGTQAAALVKEFGYTHVESGGVFRKLMKENGDSDLAQEVKGATSRGELVSDELTMAVMGEHLKFDEKSILLDGIPRSARQAEILREMLGQRNYLIIILNLSREECIARIAERVQEQKSAGLPVRADDTNPEAVAKRLDIYEQETQGSLRGSFPSDRILEVDASVGIEEVSKVIFDRINAILGNSPYTINLENFIDDANGAANEFESATAPVVNKK